MLWLVLIACSGTEVAPPVDAPVRPYKGPVAGTIKDPSTKRIWMQCAIGQELLGEGCPGEATELYEEAASPACAALSLAGLSWRLPTAKELLSLVVCPDGTQPTLESGCPEPNFHTNYNPAWFPGEGEGRSYWSSDHLDPDHAQVVSFATGQGASAAVVVEKHRVRCISEGAAFVPLPAKIASDTPLTTPLIVSQPGIPVWAEPSLTSASVGYLSGGQLVLTGPVGPNVDYNNKPAHFVPVQGHPWMGWTIDSALSPIPESGVLEAIDAAWAMSPEATPERERLVPGEQYRFVESGTLPGKVSVVLQGQPTVKVGSVDAYAFRWVEPSEFVCTRREEAIGGPDILSGLWPRDAQACEHYEVKKIDPIFPESKEVWRMYGPEGGYEGYLVDGVPVAADARPGRKIGENYVIGGVGDPVGEACGCLKVLKLEKRTINVLFERQWQADEVRWTAEADGRLSASDGNLCRLEEGAYVCTN